MTPKEVELWDGLYGVKERILEAAQAGEAFRSEFDLPDDKLLPPPTEDPEPSDFSRAVKTKGDQIGYRVNLDEVIHTPIQPFDPEGMQLFMKPHACFGGRGGQGSLYNAFIAEDIYVQDQHGRWAVDQIAGTGVHSWGADRFLVHSTRAEQTFGLTQESNQKRKILWKSALKGQITL